MRLSTLVALACFLVPAAVFARGLEAQHETFVVTPDASQVKMMLNTTHEVVTGTFHVQSGSIEFDRSSEKLAGSVVVLAASGDTGNGSRDKKMKNSILKVDKYANVSFEPKSYAGELAAAGDSTIQVSGVFRLLGTLHEITIPMLVHLEGANATVKAHFVVPYVAWGVKNPSFLIWKADNDVAIDVSLAGRLSR